MKKIKSALISVYHKEGLDSILTRLHELQVKIFSTGGTKRYIEELGIPVTAVEDLTSYPSILGGRVKTLHPKIFGGILARRDYGSDVAELNTYDIPEIDLVVVDLYPFEETVASGADEDEIIEKIDIGGISLIRAAAKNFKDTLVVASRKQYDALEKLLDEKKGYSDLSDRRYFATRAFAVSSGYDTHIFRYFNNQSQVNALRIAYDDAMPLRYGENPHQEASFYGKLNEVFEQLHGKALSYNNLLDIDAAIQLIRDCPDNTFAILKHNNACGIAVRKSPLEAFQAALAGDPVSAFGGILVTNHSIDLSAAEEINKLFFEVLIAPEFADDALSVLKAKKNRILLRLHTFPFPQMQYRTLLNGMIAQSRDNRVETEEDLKVVTHISPSKEEIRDLLFANIIVKHLKSNAIVLVKDHQLVGMGCGQPSRVDALNQAIAKAQRNGFDLQGAVMASDAFFPFADCVEIAGKAGIRAVIQPGGSIRDNESVDYCNAHDIAMVMTGIRHFRH